MNSTGQNVPLGIYLMLLAFLCFASMDTSAKWLVEANIPALQVVFLRYLVHFGWVLILYLPQQGLAITRSRQPKKQLLRAAFLFSATALNFTALVYLPLTITVAIFFASPIVVCLLSIPVLGEVVGIRRFVAIGVGFVGVLFIVKPWGQDFDWHIILALMALLCASSYFVMSRAIGDIDNNAVTQTYVSGIATVILTPVAFYLWQWPETMTQWVILCLIGSLGMFGHTLLTKAHQIAEASVLAPTVYSQIIYITLFSWLIFDSTPSPSTIFGTAIIVASGFYIWLRERQQVNRHE